jgi:hypothetical protein
VQFSNRAVGKINMRVEAPSISKMFNKYDQLGPSARLLTGKIGVDWTYHYYHILCFFIMSEKSKLACLQRYEEISTYKSVKASILYYENDHSEDKDESG